MRYEVDAILLEPYRAVYVETPKVACTSIKTALAGILGVSLKAAGGNPHDVEWPPAERSPSQSGPLFPGLFAFAFVRNPWDRLVSCYRDKIRGEVDGHTHFTIRPGVADCLARFDAFVPGMSFADFVAAVALGCRRGKKYVPTDRELMDMHVRALFTHDARSRLLSVNEPAGGGAAAPRMFFGRTREGNLWRFRADLPEALVEELEALCAREPIDAELRGQPRHFDACVLLLEAHAPVRKVWAGPAYRFAEYFEPSRPLVSLTEADAESLRGGFEDLLEELPTSRPFVTLVEDGRAVSVCRSVRITPAGHEAGVETLPDFRGKGYAREVVAGWARSVRSSDAVPLYSTSWENTASQALAKKLRLVQYGADCHVT